jgi:acetoin utilization deacetylase AcuC-like enzyme
VLTEGGKTCAVVDVDYHAGNGTQDIFYERGDVFVCSLHADPYQEYPYHVGHASETGVGAGEGCHLNVPLPVTTGDQEYLAALEGALKRVRQFNPDYVVVSFGADTAEVDPLGTMNVTQEGFGKIGAAIRALDKPTVVVFEGGYGVKELGGNTLAFLAPFL